MLVYFYENLNLGKHIRRERWEREERSKIKTKSSKNKDSLNYAGFKKVKNLG